MRRCMARRLDLLRGAEPNEGLVARFQVFEAGVVLKHQHAKQSLDGAGIWGCKNWPIDLYQKPFYNPRKSTDRFYV